MAYLGWCAARRWHADDGPTVEVRERRYADARREEPWPSRRAALSKLEGRLRVDGRCSPPASHGPLCHAHQNFDAGRVAPSDQLSVVLAGWTVLANQILTFAHRSRLRAFDPLVEAAGSISEVTQACRPCSQALGDTPTD